MSLNDATLVDLSKGKIIFNGADNSNQTITAGGQSVMSASESVNVNYDGSEVIVDGITTANESLTVNSNSYSLSGGNGFSVHINDSTTTVEDITAGDVFSIDGITFTYTEAGLAKTATNEETISFLLKAINPADNKLTVTNLNRHQRFHNKIRRAD